MADADSAVMHAISRDHKWDFACLDCRPLSTLHIRLLASTTERAEANALVAAADAAHVEEPMPRDPHEGDYHRGRRDAIGYLLDLDTLGRGIGESLE